MGFFLAIILIILFLILLIPFALAGVGFSILRSLFGGQRTPDNRQRTRASQYSREDPSYRSSQFSGEEPSSSPTSASSEKIFGADEGQYVDFEEIKTND